MDLVAGVPDVDQMHVVATVPLAARYRRCVASPVIRPTVEHLEPTVAQLDHRPHHELQCFRGRPRAHVLRPAVHVHFWRVDLERHLANAADQTGSDQVIERRPFGELDVHLQEVDRPLR